MTIERQADQWPHRHAALSSDDLPFYVRDAYPGWREALPPELAAHYDAHPDQEVDDLQRQLRVPRAPYEGDQRSDYIGPTSFATPRYPTVESRPRNPQGDFHFAPDEVNPPSVSPARPEPDWTPETLEQDTLPGDWPRGRHTPLYRGVTIDLDQAEHIGRALALNHPDLADHVLDHLDRPGLGTHWSTDPTVAHQYATNGVGNHLPVVLTTHWRGGGEDPLRTKSYGDFPAAKEITLTPGAHTPITEMAIRHPATGQWVPLRPSGMARTAALGLHPDLAESRRMHGTVHTTGGRVLPTFRTAVADAATQQSRLTDPTGWTHHVAVPPSTLAIQGARAYASLKGLADPHTTDYRHIMQTPERVARVGRHFDTLPTFSATAVPHFAAMHDEVNHQYDFLTNRLGIRVQSVDYDPYAHVGEMLDDVNNNKTLKVLGSHVTGGHPIFGNEGNDRFRAVHDFFGHAATGRDFDRHGEHATYLAHSQMFSPQALPALTTETLGQNSSLILNGHFGPNKIAVIPRELTARLAAKDDEEEEEEDEEFDGSYCQQCGEGDYDWCEDCQTCDACDPHHEKHCSSCGPGDGDWCASCEQCSSCDSDHEKHCSSCGPGDSDWCDSCETCSYCDSGHEKHCEYCGPGDSDWCVDCEACTSCTPEDCLHGGDARPVHHRSPLYRDHKERPQTGNYNDVTGDYEYYFAPHEINPASEAASRPWMDFPSPDDEDPALDFGKPLSYSNGIDNIPAGTPGAELFRGLRVNLKHPDLHELRRAIFGDAHESYYAGDPNSHQPHFQKTRYSPGHPVQPGMFSGPFSNKELAAPAADPDQLHRHLDVLLDHLERHSDQTNLGRHWSTDIGQAHSFSNAYHNSYNNQYAQLPVLLSGRWKGQGENPYRHETGETSAGEYEHEREMNLLPGAPIELHDVQVYHPQTRQWHSLLDTPQRRHARRGS